MRLGKLRLFERRVVHPSDPLLVRYILFRIPGFGIYLHHLLRSDYDRALHDHPWPFTTILLTGSYIEVHDQTTDGLEEAVLRKRWSVLHRPAKWRHRLVLSKPIWTLLFVGQRERKWGFWLPTGWCWWRQHNQELGICEDEVLWDDGSD